MNVRRAIKYSSCNVDVQIIVFIYHPSIYFKHSQKRQSSIDSVCTCLQRPWFLDWDLDRAKVSTSIQASINVVGEYLEYFILRLESSS